MALRTIVQDGDPILKKVCRPVTNFDDRLATQMCIRDRTNTIGSKCQDLAITRMVVDTKAEIEKIREQIQNIE